MPKAVSLFKYVAFSEHILDQLCTDQVYYANPSSFNDPLDCVPVVTADLGIPQLRELVAAMVTRRSNVELKQALRRLRLKGEKIDARVRALNQRDVNQTLQSVEYFARDPDVDDPQEYIRFQLTRLIQQELQQGYERGVYCLSRRWNSVLMWSHYADQHRGLCIVYDAAPIDSKSLHRVSYGASREVGASLLHRLFVRGDETVRQNIDRAALLTKSNEWKYENEVRLLGQQGLEDSPIAMKGVIFGMNCPSSTQFVIAKSLERRTELQFWQIRKPLKGFRLQRARADLDEAMATLPRKTMMYEFEAIDDPEPSA